MLDVLLGGFVRIIIYFIIFASLAFILRLLIKIPSEVFRKLLHMILIGSSFIWVYGFDVWWASAIASLTFAVIVYPILMLAEHIKGYSAFLTERKGGELKTSLLIVFSMFAVVVTVCWGIFGNREIAIAAVLAWGLGDAAAALIGKRFGKHHLKGKLIEGTKSIEGSVAMFTVSFITLITIFLFTGLFSPVTAIFVAVITGAVSAVSELLSRNGMDTVICPLSNAAILIPLTLIFGNV